MTTPAVKDDVDQDLGWFVAEADDELVGIIDEEFDPVAADAIFD